MHAPKQTIDDLVSIALLKNGLGSDIIPTSVVGIQGYGGMPLPLGMLIISLTSTTAITPAMASSSAMAEGLAVPLSISSTPGDTVSTKYNSQVCSFTGVLRTQAVEKSTTFPTTAVGMLTYGGMPLPLGTKRALAVEAAEESTTLSPKQSKDRESELSTPPRLAAIVHKGLNSPFTLQLV